MNREVEFRYYLKRENTLTHKEQIISFDIPLEKLETENDYKNSLIASLRKAGCPDFKVIAKCEFSGKLDINNIKIFEGDKVKWHTWDGYMGDNVVEFKGGRFSPVADGCLDYDRFDKNKGFEIVGNIYEENLVGVYKNE